MPDTIARIIDANLNRAREALRVLEDCARFGLNDPELSRELKTLRHELQEAAGCLPIDRLAVLAARDSVHDVGTDIKATGELSRVGLPGLLEANAARLSQALRSLEEAAKVCGGEACSIFERARYASYDLEKRLCLATASGRATQWRLCILVSENLCKHHPWDHVAARAIEAGADCIQLREKGLEDRELLDRTTALIRLAAGRASVIVNDRTDVALAAGADGVHVGPHDLPVAAVRALAGRKLLIGASCASLEDARAAVRAGADYCGIGPMFATFTKAKEVREGPALAGAYLSEAMLARVPVVAIGGIDTERAGELARMGVPGVAVSSFVCGAEDPAGACAAILRAMAIADVRGGDRPNYSAS